MKDLINDISSNIQWACEQNSNVVKGIYQPVKILNQIDPWQVETLEKMNKEQLMNIIMTYVIMMEEINKTVELLLDEEV